MIEFTSSLGVLLDQHVRTAAGIARARLQAGSVTGTASISAVATAENAVAQLQVDFLAPGTKMYNESFISISSDRHLGYDVDKQVVDSAGGVKIYTRGLTIDAEEAQIDVKKNILRAKAKLGGDNIIIKRGDKKIEASALYYDLTSMKGVILTPADSGAKRMLFRGRDLYTEPDKKPDSKISFEYKPVAESSMFVRAKSIIIDPGVDIKIKRATYFLDNQKSVSIPLQVVPLKSQAGGLDQMFSYGTDGLRVDMPFYYSLTPNGTGSVRLEHNQSTGWGDFADQTGWQVDVAQEYSLRGTTEGTFTLDRVTSSDWGMQWSDRRELDSDSQLYSYVDFPSHRDLYGSLDYSHTFSNYTLTTSSRASQVEGEDGTVSTSAFLQSRPKTLFGDDLSYSFNTKLSYDNTVVSDSDLGTGVGLQLYGKPIRFSKTSSLNTSLTLGQDVGGSTAGTSIYGSAGYNKTLGAIGQFALNYNYSWSDSVLGYNSQVVSANLSLRPSTKWNTSLNGTYGLSDGTVSAFSNMSHTFLPTWRFNVLGTFQRFTTGDYIDAEIALCKTIGRQEAQLAWSQSLKRLRMEFTALGF